VLPPTTDRWPPNQALLVALILVHRLPLVPAAEFAELDHTMESDVVVLGDQDDARAALMRSREHPNLRALDGGLASQRGSAWRRSRRCVDREHPSQDARQPAVADV